MRSLPLVALLVCCLAALAPAGASAQVPPTRFYGTVLINGEIAPPGTEIRGYVNGVECGLVVMDREDGLYVLDVAHDSIIVGCALNDGDIVTFTINGVPAGQEGAFGQGMFVEINLSPAATDGAAQPGGDQGGEPAPEGGQGGEGGEPAPEGGEGG